MTSRPIRATAFLVLAILAAPACGVREEAGAVVGPPTYEGREAVDWAEQLLAYEDDDAYEVAYGALVDLAVDYEDVPFAEAVERLHAGLQSEDEYTRFAACSGLGIFESRSRAAVGDLAATARRDPDPETRGQAVWALGRIAPPPLAFAIAVLGPEHLKTPPPEPDPEAAREASRVGLEAVVAALEDEDVEVRKEAILAVQHWGAHAKHVVKRVSLRLTDDDGSVRFHALTAVRYLDAPPELVLYRVIRLLRDEPPHTRRAAALLLQHYGEEARGAIPALEEAARDPESGAAAEAALKAIRGPANERPIEAKPEIPPLGAG